MTKTLSRLAMARRELGLSQPELAELAGTSVSAVRQLEQGTMNPHYHQSGGWKNSCELLAAALAISCDELWPMDDEELSRLSVELEGQDEVAPPDQEIYRSDLRMFVGSQLVNLSDQEQRVLTLRFGLGGAIEETLTETAAKLSSEKPECRLVTRERVRSLEAKALRKLRTSRSTPKS